MPLRIPPFRTKAWALAPLALCVTGCLSTYNHYVKSAEAAPASIPLVPAVLPSGNTEKTEVSLRGGYQGPTRREFVTKPVYETTPEPGSQGFRGDYVLRRNAYSLGIDMRHIQNDLVDWYVTAGADFGTKTRAASLVGLGFTLPFPLLSIRLSPAFGVHGYTNRVVDSVIEHGDLVFGGHYSDTSTHVIDNRALRLGLVGSISVSAWLPNPNGRWTPYIQFQGNWIGMSASDTSVTVPSGIMVLHGRVFAAGVEYTATKSLVWNTRVAGEHLRNRQDGAWGYRVETGLSLRLDK